MKKERFGEIALHLLSAATAYFVVARVFAYSSISPLFGASLSTTEQLGSAAGALTMTAFFGVIVGFYQLVAYGLRRRKFWAWVAALCVLGAHAMSLYLPVAAFGIWGLVSRSTRDAFGIQLRAENSPGTT